MSTSHPAELQLLDYVEGSLTGEELRGLRRHVTTCSACQETLRELSHAVDVLERLPTVGIPHDGMRRTRPRNRRRLLDAHAADLRDRARRGRRSCRSCDRPRTASTRRGRQPQLPRPPSVPRSSYTCDRHARPGDGLDRAGVTAALARLQRVHLATITARSSPSSTSTTSRRPARASSSPPAHSSVTVLLVGVEGLQRRRRSARRSRPGTPSLHAAARPRPLTTSGRSRARAAARRPGSSSARSRRTAP